MATLTYDYGAAFDGERVMFADATGAPDGHALVARAVVSLNALDEVRAILTRIAACWEQGCTCGAREARAALALLGGAER